MDVRKIIYLITWIMGTLALNQTDEVDVEYGHDPGECSQTNHGQLKLVQDRQDNDRLFLCSRYNNEYSWQRPDGSSTYGEFFNPGFDCSDILNHESNAQDGFYWINLNEDLARQVWCDMTTDGGGFMLIGHKTSPVSWTVPSNYTRVDPFTSHQWSSSLGNASIKDFRVQISTSNNFSDTKADWSLRLNNKRPLKELMILGKGGCDSSSPGIGDVAFVKDIMTETIVTHSFRCSKFGFAHSPESMIGWSMMNTCLKMPCKKGFAFYHGIPIQLDHSGAFSYSATEQTSGINHKATAFVGCDRGHCCACFGPVGGKGHYCTEKCRAINGGTVVKHVDTWFWVRTSLPKRVWRRCMEYQVNQNGRLAWFKLIGDDTNPVAGRCAEKEPNLSDGMVVVPDATVLNKVPRVSGLLAYRKDTGQLYLRTGSQWRYVADNRQVASTNSRILQLQSRIIHLEGFFNPRIRLSGGGSSNRGRVEVFFSLYGWGTVCDDGWNINDGHVVCRQLGYSRATAVYQRAHYGQGSGEILLDDLSCNGSEEYLWNCRHQGWKSHNCVHSEDASVDCA